MQRILVVVLVEVLVGLLVVKQADLLEVLLGLGHGLGPAVVAWGDQLQEPEQHRLHHHINSSSRKYNNNDNHHLYSSSRKYNNSDNHYQHRL